MTKQQYVCGAVYSPLANAIADCQICGWNISRHKTVDSTGKGPFGPDVALEMTVALDEALAILAIALPGPRPWPTEDIDAKLRIYRNMAEDRRRCAQETSVPDHERMCSFNELYRDR